MSYCKKLNRKVPPAFCLACRSDWKKWRRESVLEYRKKHLKPLTEEQEYDKDLVSVVMPARECEKPYIQKTIDSVKETAAGRIETIIVCDGWTGSYGNKTLCFDEVIGQRASVNRAVKCARGKYIFRLDPHCKLSSGWDARMKSSCGETDLVAPVYDHLDVETWQPIGRDVAFWWLDGHLRCRSVRPWIPVQSRKIEEDVMSMSGGAWMIQKKYYNELGGHDEFLGEHGTVGPEWSLKVWLTGGRVLIRTDVVCAHLFREMSPYAYNFAQREWAYGQLYKMWVLGEDPRRKRPMEWLLYKFNNYIKHRPVMRTTIR